jgi:hypothetical protein
MSSRYAFIITSAINTKFGIYTSDQRLAQTLNTIKSIRERAPGSKIILLEMAGLPLSDEQANTLRNSVDNLLDFTADPAVTSLYNSTDNWDVVKNVTEVSCFANALQRLTVDTNILADCQRIFKVSGRYTLTDQFDISVYDQYSTENMIIVSRKRKSQFPFGTTQTEYQYMSRTWSWPTKLTAEIIDNYNQGLQFMATRLAAGGYIDIEHMLYRFLDAGKVLELDEVGVEGNIGPNGTVVRD